MVVFVASLAAPLPGAYPGRSATAGARSARPRVPAGQIPRPLPTSERTTLAMEYRIAKGERVSLADELRKITRAGETVVSVDNGDPDAWIVTTIRSERFETREGES